MAYHGTKAKDIRYALKAYGQLTRSGLVHVTRLSRSDVSASLCRLRNQGEVSERDGFIVLSDLAKGRMSI